MSEDDTVVEYCKELEEERKQEEAWSYEQERLEAETYKYSNAVALIYKLRSGAWAIFNAQRKLIQITHSMEAVALCISSIEATVEAPPPKPGLLSPLELASLLDEI